MIDTKAADAADKAAREAEALMQAAVNARDGAETAWLDTVTNVKQINEGRTAYDAARLKAKFISVFGYQRWSKLCGSSR